MNHSFQTAALEPSTGIRIRKAMALMPAGSAMKRGRDAGVAIHAPPDPA